MEAMTGLVLPELVFDEGPHLYRLDGAEIPSVTQIMEPLSNSEYAGIRESVLQRAADRGTAVHAALESWIKWGIEIIDPEYQGYYTAFRDWWRRMEITPISSEMQVYHKLLRYAGTVDFLMEIDGELALVDFKTTSRLIDMTCRVQLEAYRQAMQSHGVDVKRKFILQLKPNGNYTFREFDPLDTEAWTVFGALQTVYNYTHKYK